MQPGGDISYAMGGGGAAAPPKAMLDPGLKVAAAILIVGSLYVAIVVLGYNANIVGCYNFDPLIRAVKFVLSD